MKPQEEASATQLRFDLTMELKIKISNSTIPETINNKTIRSGYYSFGANQLDVMAALEKILYFLEESHGLVLKKSKDQDTH
ncbi:hypothetical protein [Stutzerimonas nitrititolerans]|uniref:hypothetical protein n=1 Tax=Stutzerimonas nitrititolerans TaxID=2482751 RepID=UPI0028ABD154|nr:hypothetical protein [Stutzerimonas nitrititolerans]